VDFREVDDIETEREVVIVNINELYVEFLNRTGVLSETFEEEGHFRAGLAIGLRLGTKTYNEVEKDLIQLELFANDISRNRSVKQNKEIVDEFLKKKKGKKKSKGK